MCPRRLIQRGNPGTQLNLPGKGEAINTRATEFEAEKAALISSSVNNSLLKNRRKSSLLVLKRSCGRCQEKKLRGIHMFQLHFIIKPILLSLQLTSEGCFWLMFVSVYFIFGTLCILETVLYILASVTPSPFCPRMERFLSSVNKQE